MSESRKEHGQHRLTEQPPVSDADRESAEAALVPATAVGMPPTAQVYFAVVEANGALARGFGVVSAARLAAGQYQVVFNHDVTGSAFVASLGLSGSLGVGPSGEITVVGRYGVANGVFVATLDSSGNYADRSFHLGVIS